MSHPRATLQRKSPSPQSPAAAPRSYLDMAVWLGLVVVVFTVYMQVGAFDFTTYDDNLYVSENPQVQAGLTVDSIKYAFTAVVSNNWTPVTMLSHIVVGELFHMQSGMHHLVNVVFHALAAVLLFLVFRRATGSLMASAFVAFVFALHPLHVGSVAWIAERKDVLSAVFFFLALYAYVRYAEQPDIRRYLVVAVTFSLGLMAKPMLVTFPFVLLLFDVWPLRRFQFPKVVWEKVPLMALAAACSVVTYRVQQSTGAVVRIPLATRTENALVSYVAYIGQSLWPAHVSVIYPYASSMPAWQVAGAFAILVAISVVAVRMWRTHPYFAVGWFWYLGMLVPVIGLVQVGLQSRADRYTYLPMVGLTIMLAWGAADVLARWPQSKTAIVTAAATAGIVCVLATWVQIGYWQNSETLYQHAVEVTENNWMAQYNLGEYLMGLQGRIPDAITHLREAVRIKPDYGDAHNNLGSCFLTSGHVAEAITQFETAVKLKPDFTDAHFNLGLALSRSPGRSGDALKEFEAALRLNPNLVAAHTNMAVVLVNLGRTSEAITHFEAAVRLHPDFESEHNLGALLSMIPGRRAEAIAHLEAAQRMHPDPETSKTIERLQTQP